MLSGAGFKVDVLPEIAELGPLATEDEDGGFRTELPPSLWPKQAQISQGGVQTLAYDFAAPKADFINPMRLPGIAAVTHVVDEENPHSGKGEEGFARPFLDQVRRSHDDAGEWLALRMDKHHAQGDQGFARSTFGHNMSATGDLPALGGTHDGEGLGRVTASLPSYHGVIEPVMCEPLVALDPRVPQRGILVATKREHRLVHLLGVENLQA